MRTKPLVTRQKRTRKGQRTRPPLKRHQRNQKGARKSDKEKMKDLDKDEDELAGDEPKGDEEKKRMRPILRRRLQKRTRTIPIFIIISSSTSVIVQHLFHINAAPTMEL